VYASVTGAGTAVWRPSVLVSDEISLLVLSTRRLDAGVCDCPRLGLHSVVGCIYVIWQGAALRDLANDLLFSWRDIVVLQGRHSRPLIRAWLIWLFCWLVLEHSHPNFDLLSCMVSTCNRPSFHTCLFGVTVSGRALSGRKVLSCAAQSSRQMLVQVSS
jgi:hypothetical protein